MARQSLILLLLVLLHGGMALAQQIENVRAEKTNDGFVIWYSLTADSTDQQFEVSLYSSIDNFSKPLTGLSGEVGRGVEQGFHKKIIWTPIDTVKLYGKPFTFEVRAVHQQSVGIENARQDFRRGAKIQLSWQPTKKIGTVDITLLKKDKVAWNSNGVENEGHFQLILPKSLRIGGEYRVRLSESQHIYSSSFKVRRRIPLAAKIGLLVAGVVVTVLSSPSSAKGQSQFPLPPGGPN